VGARNDPIRKRERLGGLLSSFRRSPDEFFDHTATLGDGKLLPCADGEKQSVEDEDGNEESSHGGDPVR